MQGFGESLSRGIQDRGASSLLDAAFRGVIKLINVATQDEPLTPSSCTEALHRGRMTLEQFHVNMRFLGFDDKTSDILASISEAIPQTYALIDMQRRGILAPDMFEAYMTRIGWSAESRNLLVRQSEFYPGAQDIILWLSRDVFRPDTIKHYNLDVEWDKIDKSLFAGAGVPEDMALKYWIAHWNKPSYEQIRAMRHRRLINDEEVSRAFDLAEIPQFWRQAWLGLIFDPYTRVDIQRMWDLGVLDDNAALNAYRDLGYDDVHAANLLLFTKASKRIPEWEKQYRAGWINADEFAANIKSIGLTPEATERITKEHIVNGAHERAAKHRDLTEAQIVKAAKDAIITPSDALARLGRIGYGAEGAAVLLALAGVGSYMVQGAPETRPMASDTSSAPSTALAALVEQTRAAQGKTYLAPTAAMLDAEARLQAAQGAMDAKALSQAVYDLGQATAAWQRDLGAP